MSAAPTGAAQDGPERRVWWIIGQLLMGATVAFFMLAGLIVAWVVIGSLHGEPGNHFNRWVMAMTLIGVLPTILLMSICSLSHLRLITITWVLYAVGILCLMDYHGLAILGSTDGWWWWHYPLGGLLAVAPTGVAVLRARRFMSPSPFVAIALLAALFVVRMAVTEGSDTDRLAHLRRDLRLGMTPAELAELFHEDDVTEEVDGDYECVRVVDHEVWAPSSGWSGTLMTTGGLVYEFEFESGLLTSIKVRSYYD